MKGLRAFISGNAINIGCEGRSNLRVQYIETFLCIIPFHARLCTVAVQLVLIFLNHLTVLASLIRVGFFRNPLPAIPVSNVVGLGLRAAIDPHQIPSPIDAIEADKEQWEGETYLTLPGSHIPLSTSDYVAVDQGTLLNRNR